MSDVTQSVGDKLIERKLTKRFKLTEKVQLENYAVTVSYLITSLKCVKSVVQFPLSFKPSVNMMSHATAVGQQRFHQFFFLIFSFNLR